jgi:hypothetical protein
LLKNKIAGVKEEVFGAQTILSNTAVNVSGAQVLGTNSTDSDILSFFANKGKGEQAFSIPPVDTTALIESLDASKLKLKEFMNDSREIMLDFSGLVTDALSGLGYALGSAISGSQDLGEALLGVLGKVLTQLGEMILTAGIGVEAFKTSLESLNGYVAVAAGIALIALGSAISGSISDLGSNPTGGGSGSSTGRGGRGSNVGSIGAGGFEIKIGGEFRIKGPDLVYIIDRNTALSDRTTG